MLKNKFGITLIALMTTVVVLLILAGVSINFIFGNEGIFTKAQTAVEKYQNAAIDEESLIAKLSNNVNSNRDDSETVALLMKKIEDLEKQVKGVNPPGTVISYIAGNSAPTGYLKCDGSVYNVSDYPNLANAILDGFGKYDYWGGDGTTTFAVPDLRGEFLRGTGQSGYAGAGPGGDVGAHQRGSIVNGTYSDGNNFGAAKTYLDIGDSTAFNWGNLEECVYPDKFYSAGSMRTENGFAYSTSDSSSMSKMGRYTVRPTNTSVLYCIKY